jgi:hypothetical protein
MIGQNQASHPLLATLSGCYAGLWGRSVTCYSPVRHSPPKWCVRLACLKHAASVHPEPGSNSPKMVDLKSRFMMKRLADLSECWPSTTRVEVARAVARTVCLERTGFCSSTPACQRGLENSLLALNCQETLALVKGSRGTPSNEAKGMVSPHFEAVKLESFGLRSPSWTG